MVLIRFATGDGKVRPKRQTVSGWESGILQVPVEAAPATEMLG